MIDLRRRPSDFLGRSCASGHRGYRVLGYDKRGRVIHWECTVCGAGRRPAPAPVVMTGEAAEDAHHKRSGEVQGDGGWTLVKWLLLAALITVLWAMKECA